MNPADAELLRRAAAHALVEDVAAPSLDEDSTHHLFRVLRVADGDMVTVTDGTGGWRPCRAASSQIIADGDVRYEPRPSQPLTIAITIPKHDRPEWIAQKLTEIGVDQIIWLHAQRSVVRWDAARATKRLDKMRRVVAEALQQSRRVWLPVLSGPVDAATILSQVVIAEPAGRQLTSDDRTIAIGPEGGWAADEVEVATAVVTLGESVLRVETAAIAAAVLAIGSAR